MALLRFAVLSLVTYCRAQTVSHSQPIILPTGPANPASTACGDIIVEKEQTGNRFFWASDVFECLQSVPFDPAVASRFLGHYNQTLQFQSTLAFLKQPPQGYQQPSIDVLEELNRIQDNVNAGLYTTQYIFEAEIQLVINRIHDAHISLSGGILAPFGFASPYGLISASADGHQTPSIYILDDVVESQLEEWTPSPITHINGIDAVEYLTSFADLNSQGYLEANADWNALFGSPTIDIQDFSSALQSATFYPGDELNFTCANGTEINTWWEAVYTESYETGPLTTAGDFYNYFVLGLLPASYDPDVEWWPPEVTAEGGSKAKRAEPTEPNYGCSDQNPQPQNWCQESYGAYPNNPDVAQESLNSSGVVTGYLLDDISTGVLSIPSFFQTDDDRLYFIDAVEGFVNLATEHNTSKVVIDLQQNRGGEILLALSVFKMFFPDLDPYTGSRIRSHELSDVLGNAYSTWWDEGGAEDADYEFLASSEWIATNRINDATGADFKSWAEYYGPILDRDDAFSAVQSYNLSDEKFDFAAFNNLVPYGYTKSNDSVTQKTKWAPQDIVLLTDGLCSSACAYFVELMAHYAGVHTIVAGGRPTDGPMQTASGNRGAHSYTSAQLDSDFTGVNETLNNTTAFSRLPNRTDTGMWIDYATLNIRDQMRQDDPIPLQFKYEAAECRIYYTLANAYNMSRLWRDAAAATWTDTSLCVHNSVGYAVRVNDTETKAPPPRKEYPIVIDLGENPSLNPNYNATFEILDTVRHSRKGKLHVEECLETADCTGTYECIVARYKSTSGHRSCVKVCAVVADSESSICQPESGFVFKRGGIAESKGHNTDPKSKKTKKPRARSSKKVQTGHCIPTKATLRENKIETATCPS
ncbi:hypothetical protein BCR34DRAFT_571405 [Clohesyomyces aquaticus]|uniref:CPAF-like PDZ domain-containing protein n=1 Tax=Clohesyomyces aquaticus TaxID=1231657 RepID=A0A1Y1Z8G8_9PLEO|nr:hypothetical protein BCR34DRAFT_571405 [Clohesyomyces aquaticus]